MSTSQFHHRTENAIERRAGWINVGDLSSAVHFKIVKYERIKFLVIGEMIFDILSAPAYNILHSLFFAALRDSIEIYAWAPKPYHKFMAFKSFSGMLTCLILSSACLYGPIIMF